MALEMIPGISALYNILKRDVERGNDILEQRKALSKDLLDNCNAWTAALLQTFDRIMQNWENDGRDAAMKQIEAQMYDFMKLDYHSLENHSPILLFLRGDSRFEAFAHACCQFYQSALDLKRLVYGQIEESPNHHVSSNDVGMQRMVELWHEEVGRMLQAVRREHNAVKTIIPK
jgi:hypothetical protein